MQDVAPNGLQVDSPNPENPALVGLHAELTYGVLVTGPRGDDHVLSSWPTTPKDNVIAPEHSLLLEGEDVHNLHA